jgi:hypothetical protein
MDKSFRPGLEKEIRAFSETPAIAQTKKITPEQATVSLNMSIMLMNNALAAIPVKKDKGFIYDSANLSDEKTKKEFNGFISLKELFTTLTLTIIIGILISQSFTYLFNNFIDAEYGNNLNEFMNEQQIVAQNAMKSFTKVTSEDLKKIAETNNFSILNILQGSLIAFLLSSVMNLILAAIFKKNQPVF